MGELCHAVDSGDGRAHECHEVGHEGDGERCLPQFAGCVALCTGDEAEQLSLEQARCSALGELCHPVDDRTGPLHDCHLLGERGDPGACSVAFDDCARLCLQARELLDEGSGGAGGRGGGDPANGGAGDVATSAGTAGSSE